MKFQDTGTLRILFPQRRSAQRLCGMAFPKQSFLMASRLLNVLIKMSGAPDETPSDQHDLSYVNRLSAYDCKISGALSS